MCDNTAAGNHSTLIIDLEESLVEEDLRSRIDSIYNSLPILSGRLSRDMINLAPYWKIPKLSLRNYDIAFVDLTADDNTDAKFIEVLNSPFSSGHTYLSFKFLKRPGENYLLMTFDHRILDARGAELFLNLLVELNDDNLASTLSEIKTTDSPQLKDWGEKFAAGRTVQRKMITFSKEDCFTASKYSMKDIPITKDINLTPEFYHFSSEESAKIAGDAEKKAGFMMETAYLLAMTSKAFHELTNPRKTVKYFVPVPIDMRIKGEETKKTLFNHLSFMFFFFEITEDTTSEKLICEIRKQFFMQIEEGFPEEMIKAAYPGRIFPHWLLKRVMKLPFDGKNCTFVFSNVGQSSFNHDNILGRKVKDIYHMPRIPTPPGLGIFYNRVDSKFNLTVISDNNAMEVNFGARLKDKIGDLLLNA